MAENEEGLKSLLVLFLGFQLMYIGLLVSVWCLFSSMAFIWTVFSCCFWVVWKSPSFSVLIWCSSQIVCFAFQILLSSLEVPSRPFYSFCFSFMVTSPLLSWAYGACPCLIMPLYLSLRGQLLLIAFSCGPESCFLLFHMPGLSALHCLLVLVERYYPPCQLAWCQPLSLEGLKEKGPVSWCFALCLFLFCDIGWALESFCGTFSGSVLATNSAALAWVPVMRLFIYLKGNRHCQACSAGTWVGLLAAFWWVHQPFHPGAVQNSLQTVSRLIVLAASQMVLSLVNFTIP